MSDSASRTQGDKDVPARPGKGRGRPKVPLPPAGQRHSFDFCGEVEDVLGVVLWKRVRAVKLWASTPRERRRGLFMPPSGRVREQFARAVEEAPELQEPLGTLMALVRWPERARPTDVAAACLVVAEWAEGKGKLETALQFAEAAAAARPRDPGAAAMAGQFCTRVAAVDRAVVWLQRAVVLARRAMDRVWYIRGHLRLGFLMFHLGDYEQARRLYVLASRMATRTGRRGLAGQAQHDLFTVACEVGTYEEAEDHAWKALELYPVRHPAVPYLAHDYAWLLNREGFFSSAHVLLRATLPLIAPHRRLPILGSLARACAGTGDREGYAAAAAEVLRLADTTDEGAAAALIHVAGGALWLGDPELAETAAARALEIAIRREEGEPQRSALAILEGLTAPEPPPPDHAPPEGARIRELTARFLARLRKWSSSAAAAAGDAPAAAPPPARRRARSPDGRQVVPPAASPPLAPPP
jgi:tetratricopeptide (TPR) repeat protein